MAFDIVVPDMVFKTRIESDESPGFEWYDLTSSEVFANKRVVVFALPGAFTPTCSSTHLPGYEMDYDAICKEGIDEIYCLSVNDSFVMNAWLNSMEIKKVKPLPDGSAQFTKRLGFLVDKDNLGFGARSWRYSMVVDNGVVEAMFVERGLKDNASGDPFEVSDSTTMLEYLKALNDAKK